MDGAGTCQYSRSYRKSETTLHGRISTGENRNETSVWGYVTGSYGEDPVVFPGKGLGKEDVPGSGLHLNNRRTGHWRFVPHTSTLPSPTPPPPPSHPFSEQIGLFRT